MKKHNLFFITILSVMLAVFLGACSKDDDDDDNPTPQQQEAPQIETQMVELPDAMIQSDNPGATQATSYVNIANAFVGWSGMMIPPNKSGSLKSTMNDPWIYTWDYNDGVDIYSVTLTVLETETQVEWTMVINGTMGGEVFTNFMYMEASELLDGSAGTFVMYDWENQGAIGMIASWSTDSNGVYYVTFEVPNEIKIEMVSNPNGSGSVMFYEFYDTEYLLEFMAEWTADGTGQWWEYYMGELVDEGFWPDPK